MLLHGEDTLSFLSCLGNSYHVPQKALLGKTAIASSLQQSPSPPLLHQVQCNSNNHLFTPEVSKSIFRLQQQGIQVTPKILRRVKKEEAWKAIRRERREKEKADRVPDPVWYDWPDELGMLEMRKLGIARTEDEGADEFLCFVDKSRPSRRIAVRSVDTSGLSVSREAASMSVQKRAVNVRKRRKFVTKESSGDMAILPAQSIAQVWRSSGPMRTENVRCSTSEVHFPWRGRPVIEDSGAGDELKEYMSSHRKDSNSLELTEALILDEGFQESEESEIAYKKHLDDEEFPESSNLDNCDTSVYAEGHNYATSCDTSENHRCNRLEAVVKGRLVMPYAMTSAHTHTLSSKAGSLSSASSSTLRSFTETATRGINTDGDYVSVRKELYTLRDSNTAQIEKFLDDEIDEAPKGQEVWMKGVGLIKNKKPLFSKEIKERIIARRKGDWSVLYEADNSDSELNPPPMVLFDAHAALLEDRRIQRLAARLQDVNYWNSKVQFSKIMHSGKMKLTEDRVIRIIQILGEKGNWRRAMQVVQWVHKRQRFQFHISKFVFTTLISILGKAWRPVEASTVFRVMREKFSSYPDMAAYHAIAVTLGQAGKLKELLQLIESLEAGPPEPIKFVPLVHWDPVLHPDIVVYNSVLTACISTKEWAGVTWTWEEIEKKHIKPNGATFGLTVEAMVKANNFNQAIRYCSRMERAGFPPNAQTYKCLVEAFGKAKMTDQAMELVKEMEASGVVATASVYFALACSLCIEGRIKEALVQVRKMQDLSSRKPDVITYTGLIQTCHKVGRIQDAIFLFKHMQHTCPPNVRTCNEMIKIYGWNGMFEEAIKVYEGIKKGQLESCLLFDGVTQLSRDSFTFEIMLKAALVSEHWDYFDSVYWDMISQGFHLRGKTNHWVLLKAARLKKIDITDDMLRRLRKSGEIPQLRLYEAHILACLQTKCIQKALYYLNDMRIDGYEVIPTINSLQEQVEREAWDSFKQILNSLERFGTCEER